jgi:hypothetical protein
MSSPHPQAGSCKRLAAVAGVIRELVAADLCVPVMDGMHD